MNKENSVLEMNSSRGNLLKGPLQVRLEQIDRKCSEKEKLEKTKKKLSSSTKITSTANLHIKNTHNNPSPNKKIITQSLSIPKREKIVPHNPLHSPSSSSSKDAELQRIVNLISKMSHNRGGRLGTSLNRLTSFPSTPESPQSLLPKRKRDAENYCSPIKRFRDEKFVIHDSLKQPPPQKKTPFILPENFIRIVK